MNKKKFKKKELFLKPIINNLECLVAEGKII